MSVNEKFWEATREEFSPENSDTGIELGF